MRLPARAAGLPGALVALLAYGIVSGWLGGCAVSLLAAKEGFRQAQVTDRGEVVYSTWSPRPGVEWTDGRPLTDTETREVSRRALSEGHLGAWGTWSGPGFDRPGTRWAKRLERWYPLHIYSNGYDEIERERWYPIPGEGTLARYDEAGRFRGRIGPDGYRETPGPMRGFSEAGFDVQDDPEAMDRLRFWISDTGGAMLLDLSVPDVVRRIAPASDRYRGAFLSPPYFPSKNGFSEPRKETTLLAFRTESDVFLRDETGTLLGRLPIPEGAREENTWVRFFASAEAETVGFIWEDVLYLRDRRDGRPLARIDLAKRDASRAGEWFQYIFAVEPAPGPFALAGILYAWRTGDWKETGTAEQRAAARRSLRRMFVVSLAVHLLGAILGPIGAGLLGASRSESLAWAGWGLILALGILPLLLLRGPRRPFNPRAASDANPPILIES